MGRTIYEVLHQTGLIGPFKGTTLEEIAEWVEQACRTVGLPAHRVRMVQVSENTFEISFEEVGIPQDSPLRADPAWSMLMVSMGALAYWALGEVKGKHLRAAIVIPHYDNGTCTPSTSSRLTPSKRGSRRALAAGWEAQLPSEGYWSP